MKDLKRYITKSNHKYVRKMKLPIDYVDPSDIEFLAYCIFNSFEKEINYSSSFYRFMQREEYLNLSLQYYGGNNFEDYDMPSDHTRSLIINALFPKAKIDDLEVYFDSYWSDREEDYFEENIDLIIEFANKHKIKKKIYKAIIDDKVGLEDSRIFAIVIESNHLKRVYKDPKLRELFELSIFDGAFISPTKYLVMKQIYNDGYGDEPQVDKIAFIKFIEEYKKINKLKRESAYNYEYARQMLEINQATLNNGVDGIIYDILENFETKTEVMF